MLAICSGYPASIERSRFLEQGDLAHRCTQQASRACRLRLQSRDEHGRDAIEALHHSLDGCQISFRTCAALKRRAHSVSRAATDSDTARVYVCGSVCRSRTHSHRRLHGTHQWPTHMNMTQTCPHVLHCETSLDTWASVCDFGRTQAVDIARGRRPHQYAGGAECLALRVEGRAPLGTKINTKTRVPSCVLRPTT